MDIQYGLAFPVHEVKATGDAWAVEGFASTYGNVDHGGDVVLRGAFDATLRSDRRVRFLLGHDATKILGTPIDLRSEEKGLWGKFKISKTSLGQDVHTLLKDGALDSFSIGYMPTVTEFDDDGVRLLKEIELLEVSLVAVPMNDQAVVTGVKQNDPPETADPPKPEMKFDEHCAFVMDAIAQFKERFEELAALRAGEGKRLSEAKFAQLKSLRDGLDELLRLETPTNGAPVQDSLRLRLAIARRRLQAAGIITENPQ